MIETRKLDIGWGTLWRLFAFILITFILFEARSIIGALFVAIVISIGVDPFVSYLEKYKISRLFSTVIAFLAGLLILSLTLYSVLPVIITEIVSLSSFVATTVTSLIQTYAPQIQIPSLAGSINEALGLISSAGASVGGIIQVVFGNAFLVFLSFVAAFYLTVEKNGPERFLMNVIPKKHEDAVLNIFENFKKKICRWFFGQLLLSMIAFSIVTSGLWLLGVKYSLAIGVCAGLLELIPIVGPTIAGILGILVALGESFPLAIYTLIFFVIIQQLDGNLFYPYIMGRTARVHPLIVIISILIGWNVAGFIGVILAVPSAVMAQEIFGYISDNKNAEK